jgi:uncharacterized protein (DUF1330 family)
MAAYCFFDVREVIDPAKLEQYQQGVLATVQHYSGRYVVLGGRCEGIEGTWRPVFPVLIRFPNLEQAYAWYNSAEYRDLRALRRAGSNGDAVFIESEPSAFIAEE